MYDKINGDLQACLRCGNMFWHSGFGKCICAKCKEEDEEQFNIVKNYIYEHFEATLMEVSKETGVRVIRIKNYIKEGRLIIPDGSAVFLNCENCGCSIKFGRVCRECANTISNELRKGMNLNEFEIGEKPNQGCKMRFLDKKIN